jgi:3-hydroxyacyl-CoA dehydrogenase
MRHESLSSEFNLSIPRAAGLGAKSLGEGDVMTLRRVAKVAVLGANGAMGSGCGEIFAADGIETAFLARDHEKAREGLERAQSMAKSDKIADFVQLGTYDRELDVAVAEADLVFEALAEDLPLKQEFFERVDRLRRPDSIVATVSSGLSIAAMAKAGARAFASISSASISSIRRT